MNKVCKQCESEKLISEFRHQKRNDKMYVSGTCKKCDNQNGKLRHLKFRESHREELRQANKIYYNTNKSKIKERQKDKKTIWDASYYRKNKKKIRIKQQLKSLQKYKNEPNFRIRKTVSKAISRHLKSSFSSKTGKSCLNYLEYRIQDLKEHLEYLWEPWMNWKNYGIYNKKTWNNNDPTTWTWNIDHIIPQSDLPYTSMEDENFKKCWSLDNLRPLSSKVNNLDGIQRIRHRRL